MALAIEKLLKRLPDAARRAALSAAHLPAGDITIVNSLDHVLW